MNRPALAIALTLSLASCGYKDDLNRLKAENQQLKGRVAELEGKLDDELNGAARLLAKAKSEMERGNLDAAQAAVAALQGRHPDAPQAVEAKALAASITKAVAKKKADEEARKLRAAARMSTSNDEIKGVTWYRDRDAPRSGTYISLYFGDFKQGGLGPLRLKVQYSSDNWLFAHGITLKADDRTFELSLGEWKRDNGSGTIWEWADVSVNAEIMAAIRAVQSAKKGVIRFHGDKYHDDHDVSAGERVSMDAVLTAYTNLGGKPPG